MSVRETSSERRGLRTAYLLDEFSLVMTRFLRRS
jgi:hypothetical protein